MDTSLLIVYGLIFIISLCLLVIVFLLGLVIIYISSKKVERSYQYLKNLTYAIFGGIIAVVLLEVRGENFTDWSFYAIKMPIAIITILLFLLCGFLYLHLLDKVFDYLKKIKGKGEKIKKKSILILKWINTLLFGK